jgi:hypothetical protein
MQGRTDELILREDKSALLLKIVCVYWLFTKVLTWRLWTTNRVLPTAPAFEVVDNAPAAIHLSLFILSAVLMILLFLKSNRWLLMILLITEALLCLLDLNRLTPWEYFYLFIIFVFVINYKSSSIIPSAIGFILASTYFYGGLCKLNPGFLDVVWAKMLLKHFLKVSPEIIANEWIYYCGYLLAAGEIVGGIGLLFKKTQARSALALITMHLFILLLFSPLGFSGYRPLWPWNICLILLLYFIFLDKEKLPIVDFLLINKRANKLLVLFWAILPVASFFGYWDRNLSSNLFSANIPKMIICIADTSKCKDLERFCSRKDFQNTCHGLSKIDIQTWAFVETGASVYPQVRTYRLLQKKLEKKYAAAGLNFVYLDR